MNKNELYISRETGNLFHYQYFLMNTNELYISVKLGADSDDGWHQRLYVSQQRA